MKAKVRSYKRKFDRDLKHVKNILNHQRQSMPYDEWLTLVDQTKRAIMNSPTDFFSYELALPDIINEAIERVFEGFLYDQKIRATQTQFHLKYLIKVDIRNDRS